jgi:hypothetical protein
MLMIMKKTRREHYVPKFYLDSFGEVLFAFDKISGRIFRTTAKNLALETGFYDLDPAIDLEGLIAENENRMRVGISELIDKKNPLAISSDARVKISLFVALQSIRTKEHRAEIQEMGGKLMTELAKHEGRFKDLRVKVTMKDDAAKALQAEMIVSDAIPRLAWILDKLRWTLVVNRTKTPFWTSDNPVVLINPKNIVGFAVKGNQTHIPLSNKLLLTMLDPRSYDTPPVMIVKDPKAMLHENRLQLYNATRFAFSSKNEFSMAKKIWEKDESLRETHERVRVQTIEKAGRSIILMNNS